MKKFIIIIAELIFVLNLWGTNYYVSPNGNDANAGTLSSPKFNISALVNTVNPGDTIFILPGTYNYSNIITLTKSGTASKRICIFGIGYSTAEERPLLNFSSQGPGDSNRAFFLKAGANYWHLKGFIIKEAGDNGIKIESNWNIIEFIDFDGCYDSGIQIGLAKDSGSNDGSCAYNYILNCDSYNNCDSHKSGGNADGFACKLFCGPGNIFENCRAWNNSDDGWDFYSNTFGVLLLNCRTWHNGDATTLRGNKSGNGNGFKMGGNSTYSRGTNIAVGCIAFDMHYVGGGGKCFDQNDNQDPQVMLNCTTFDNVKGFSMASGSSGHTIKNCIGFNSRDKIISDQDQNITQNNSWQFGPNQKDKQNGGIANYDDFIVDLSNNDIANQLAANPRNVDGSIPDNGFCRLSPSSDCIDKGQVVSYTFMDKTYQIPYTGIAPDLGAYEYQPSTGIFHTIQNNISTNLRITNTQITDIATVLFYLEKTEPISLSITDMSGKKVMNCIDNQIFPSGNNYHIIYLGNLSKGMYILHLNSKNNRQSIKFIR
ncbi:MAG TPA: T9SS type A sorting domain-containing protein [Paludibacteraceae bacterium]|nr:T9SS type A sorting domain-containing protein [Paludibacteraceae bacterium]